MKTKQHSILIVIMLVTTLIMSLQHANAANSTSYQVLVKKTGDGVIDPDADEEGHRLPARPIILIIQEDGIISTINTEAIISYEILDIDGLVCIASFTEETEFTNYLFIYPGEYQIRLLAEDYYYVGEISTL